MPAVQSAVDKITSDVAVTGLGVHRMATSDHVCEAGDIPMFEVGVSADVSGSNVDGVNGKGDSKGSGQVHMSSDAVGATIGSGSVLDMREAFSRTSL